jgi:hypothetical protein
MKTGPSASSLFPSPIPPEELKKSEYDNVLESAPFFNLRGTQKEKLNTVKKVNANRLDISGSIRNITKQTR